MSNTSISDKMFYDKLKTSLKYNDMYVNTLEVGDKVVMIDINDMIDNEIPRGTVLIVSKLLELDTNYIEFDSLGQKYSFYGHRVLKLKL
jgi:hypothetical protein